MVAPTLPKDEQDEKDRGGDDCVYDPSRRPGLGRRLDDPPKEQPETYDGAGGADRIRSLGGRVLGVGDYEGCGDESQCRNGHVDEEDRAPPVMHQKEPTEYGADCDTQPGRPGPDPDRTTPVSVTDENV